MPRPTFRIVRAYFNPFPTSPITFSTDLEIGGLKVVTENGWFAARPSGTEDVYKIYAESFRGRDHLCAIQDEAQAIVKAAFDDAR